MTLNVEEFLRRFFLHVLPRGFVRIRHFGFLTNPQPQTADTALPGVTASHWRDASVV
jgi:hypothetical protein